MRIVHEQIEVDQQVNIGAKDGEWVSIEIREDEDTWSEVKLTADQARQAATRLLQAAWLADPELANNVPGQRW